jgi:SAM-dependent methyltransferase
MNTTVGLSSYTIEHLQCPSCKGQLSIDGEEIICSGGCGKKYPTIEGVPILIKEEMSVFSIADFLGYKSTFFSKRSKLARFADHLKPRLGRNINAERNYNRLAELLLEQMPSPKVLVLGGSILGEGMQVLLDYPQLELIDTDVSHGPRTKIICDAHDIPFADGAFDAVIVQAVLEHVVDPYRCAEEIHRVCKPKGLVYAETPFLYPVHGRCYDFTRFSHLGHRRLFRKFSEIDSGIVCGPGMMLARSWLYFLWSFSNARVHRKMLQIFASLTSWPLKYFDSYLIRKNASFDASAGFYFLGKRSDTVLSDKDLLKLYRGGF